MTNKDTILGDFHSWDNEDYITKDENRIELRVCHGVFPIVVEVCDINDDSCSATFDFEALKQLVNSYEG